MERETQEADRESEPADLVRSLEDLENLRASAEQRVQKKESSREFYLALWKASPFVLIPLFTSTLIAFATYGVLGYFFLVALVSVFGVGLYSWHTTRALDKELTEARTKAEASRKNLAKGIALVELEFLKLKPSTSSLYIENIGFDERMEYLEWFSLKNQLNPHLLKDMIHSEGRLIEVMDSLDNYGIRYIAGIKAFHMDARARIIEIDTRLRVVQTSQPNDRMPTIARALYYALSGTISSLEEATNQKRELGLSNQVIHWLQLLLGPTDKDNLYPELMNNSELKEIAVNTERTRRAALDNEKMIRTSVQVLIGDSDGSVNIGVR